MSEPGLAAPPLAGAAPSWAQILTALAGKVLATLDESPGKHTEGADDLPPTRNAKGDHVRSFDRAAHEAVVAGLEEAGVSGLLLSEEGAPREVGPGPPQWQFICDPVDGSDNWGRGLPLSAFSCAVLPWDAPLGAEHVVAAIVAPTDGAPALLGVAGEGAWASAHKRASGGTSAKQRTADKTTAEARHALATRDTARLSRAMVSVELNHHEPAGPLARTLRLARGVRSYGCASRALALVATGALDAHIDLRDRLTPESWLAAAFLVREAGGVVASPDGAPLAPVRDLLDRRSLIAAATPALLQAIVEELDR